MIISSVFFLMRNVDKFIVIALLGKKTAGYYGLAAFLSNAVRYVSYSASSALLPRAMYAYGKTKNIKDLELYYTKPITVMAGFIPVILGLLFINIGAIVNLLLPQYMPSITVLQIFIIGLFFTTIWGPPINILVALKKQKKLMYINALLLLCGIIMEFTVIQMGFGISGVAVVVTCMFMVASVIANSLALSLLKNNSGAIWNSLGMIYLPFLYSLGGLLLISLLPESRESIIDEAVKSLIYLLYCIPLLLYTEKKSGIIGKIFSAAKNLKK
jgi:O-antigen/teichoic acid export membrane protein